jgi:hypothetical protein
MTYFSYEGAALPIREDLKVAFREYWRTLAKPGCWWSGAERVAIAQETRNAVGSAFFRQGKRELFQPKLSVDELKKIDPEYVQTDLDDLSKEVVNRVVIDQNRISQAYIDDLDAAGMRPEKYVELVGIVVTFLSIDEFNRALDLPLEALPEPISGASSEYVPSQASHVTGFVPMLPIEGAVDSESDLWDSWAPNVVRALSAVPDAVRGWIKISGVQYLSMGDLVKMKENTDRAIDRAQMELIAGRVSAMNECFY